MSASSGLQSAMRLAVAIDSYRITMETINHNVDCNLRNLQSFKNDFLSLLIIISIVLCCVSYLLGSSWLFISPIPFLVYILSSAYVLLRPLISLHHYFCSVYILSFQLKSHKYQFHISSNEKPAYAISKSSVVK